MALTVEWDGICGEWATRENCFNSMVLGYFCNGFRGRTVVSSGKSKNFDIRTVWNPRKMSGK